MNGMECISEELVEETWQEMAGFTPVRMNKEMSQLARSQPNLLAFMVEFTLDLNQPVKELAIYMFLAVYRMFRKATHRKIKRILPEEVIRCYERNEDLVESLEGAHDKFYDRIAQVQMFGQPYVMKYVLEALFEAPEEKDSVDLTEEDIGFLFLLVKTAIDLLNEAANS